MSVMMTRACAGEFTDARGNDADGAGAGDEDVLADQREHERRVGGVAEGVKECNDVLGKAFVNGDHVRFRNADVLCKRAVAVNADADGVLAPLDVARMAVAAAVAGDVTLAETRWPMRRPLRPHQAPRSRRHTHGRWSWAALMCCCAHGSQL